MEKLNTDTGGRQTKIVLHILHYYMAYRSMMEMVPEPVNIFQSGPTDGPLTSRFVLLWTINLFQKLCCIVQKGFSFEKVE